MSFFGAPTSFTPIMAHISLLWYIPERAWDDIYWARAGINFCAIRCSYLTDSQGNISNIITLSGYSVG